jgi:hypothetical protein
MSVLSGLQAVLETRYFAWSKSRYPLDELLEEHGEMPAEAEDYWLVPCSHVLGAPASDAQIDELRSAAGGDLPVELLELLRLANGAELFGVRPYSSALGDYRVPMYRLLGCSQLVSENQQIYDAYRSYAEDDPQYADVDRLNYLAFCDIGDGDYLAMVLGGDEVGTVFLLDHDFAFYPFGADFTREAYTPVAGSIAELLALLARTCGRAGMPQELI